MQTPIAAVQRASWGVCDEFLHPAELDRVLEAALGNPTAYRTSGVLNDAGDAPDVSYRRSSVRFDEPYVGALFADRLRACAGCIFERLRMEPFRIARLEIQITRSGEGEYFKLHSDNAHESLRSRRVTFIYYFHREPKAFIGGALRLFESRYDGVTWQPTQRFVDIEPRQNRLLVFPSFLMHEVLPVSVPSDAFEDGRFTVNGWLHDGGSQ